MLEIRRNIAERSEQKNHIKMPKNRGKLLLENKLTIFVEELVRYEDKTTFQRHWQLLFKKKQPRNIQNVFATHSKHLKQTKSDRRIQGGTAQNR